MKYSLVLFLLCVVAGSLRGVTERPNIRFTENRGQVSCHQNKSRPDVLFYGATGKFDFYLRKTGLSYQLSRVVSWRNDTSEFFGPIPRQDRLAHESRQVPEIMDIFRIDIDWLDINSQIQVEHDSAFPGSDNYYLASCPQGIVGVQSYSGVTYRNIYNGIDLHYYARNGLLKYDYIVAPNADYTRIRFQVRGPSDIRISKDGRLIFRTPHGTIIENKPVVFQEGKRLIANWVVESDSIISFAIENIDRNKPMTIDPLVRLWGTYFGGNWDDVIYSSSTDGNKNLFIAGSTNSQILIATNGAHQTTFGSPGFYAWNKDAFLAKFDSNGVKVWGTYYGDWNYEEGIGCATDKLNNVYLSGYVNGSGTTTILATPGAFNTTPGSGFLAKFNSSGVRIWSTYHYGRCGPCATDQSNNVYITGRAQTQPSVGIYATANAHQTTFAGWFDGFLAKFSPTGQRLWSTYYGGQFEDYMAALCTDQNRNVYLCGYTNSNSGTYIATSGAHQVSDPLRNGHDYDAFLAKFDSTGTRLWGTYYGGPGFDWGYSTAVDPTGNVYLTGQGSGSASFTTANCHQLVSGGSYDAFVVKFNATGVRQWGTLLGGAADDAGLDCVTDEYSNVFISGATGSASQIATTTGYQTSASGNWDAFMVKFDGNGNRLWGTYYGGSGHDRGQTCAIDRTGNLYMSGYSTSSANIASSGSYQDTLGGNADSYIVKFSDCFALPAPTHVTPVSNLIVCSNTSPTLSATGTGIIKWYSGLTSTTSIATGSTFVPAALGSGTYSLYAETFKCVSSTNRTLITYTVLPDPVMIINGPDSVCQGMLLTLTAGGSAQQYSWSTGGSGPTITFTPSSAVTVTLTGLDTNGCRGLTTKSVFIKQLPQLQITGPPGICEGFPANLHGNAPTVSAPSVTWSTSYIGSPLSISPTITTVFGASITGNNGCIGSNSKTVTVYQKPVLNISSNSSLSCAGDPVTLNATGGALVVWSHGLIGPTAVFNPSITTSYSITGISQAGCTNTLSFPQLVSNCTALAELDGSFFIRYFPVPADNILNVKVPMTDIEITILITNSLQQIVRSYTVKTAQLSMDLSDIAEGVYYVSASVNGKINNCQKIIVSR